MKNAIFTNILFIVFGLVFFLKQQEASMILSGVSDGKKMDDRGESVLLPSPVLLIEIK